MLNEPPQNFYWYEKLPRGSHYDFIKRKKCVEFLIMKCFPRSAFPVFGFATLFVPLAFSDTLTISAGGTSLTQLTPSADSLILNSSSTFMTSAAVFAIQTGVYTVGNSGLLTGTFPFTTSENITLDGQTQLVTLDAQNFVTNDQPGMPNTDVLTIFAQSVFFPNSGETLNIEQFQSPAYTVGGVTNFTLMGSQAVALSSTPEPSTLLLLALPCPLLFMVITERVVTEKRNIGREGKYDKV